MRTRDQGQRIKATRNGRQKGIRVYIDSESLRKLGIDPDGPAPYYRIWAGRRGSCVIRLYPCA